jgi:hypothetical protein
VCYTDGSPSDLAYKICSLKYTKRDFFKDYLSDANAYVKRKATFKVMAERMLDIFEFEVKK